MIGNDIIDLKLARQQSNWKRKGFLEKVFSPSERELLNASEDLDICVWLLWSMKEAAYKAHQRRFSLPRRLNWKIQECISLNWEGDKATGVIGIEEEEYFITSNLTSASIHSLASAQSKSLYRDNLYQLPLSKVKQLFKEEISERLNMPLPQLRLAKTENGIPQLFLKNSIIPHAFSFSDHGRFSGFCVALMDS